MLQSLNGPLSRRVVGHQRILGREGSPISAGTSVAFATVAFPNEPFLGPRPKPLRPPARLIKHPIGSVLMKQLADAHRVVALLPEVLGQENDVGGDLVVFPDLVIVNHAVDAGGGRPQTGHQRRPGGATQRSLAVRVLEQHAPGRQFVQVGRLGIRMPAHTAQPIVEVIHGNKEHVWWLGGLRYG